ncbi:hypothetical protein DVH24_018405, partial [Malus domestica]
GQTREIFSCDGITSSTPPHISHHLYSDTLCTTSCTGHTENSLDKHDNLSLQNFEDMKMNEEKFLIVTGTWVVHHVFLCKW